MISSLLFAELAMKKTMENLHVRRFPPRIQKLCIWWQPRYQNSRTSIVFGLLCVCGRCISVSVLCVTIYVCVCVGAFGSVYWCARTPHSAVCFFSLLHVAAVSCLDHTVCQAVKPSTFWQPRYNSSRTANVWGYY